MLYIYLNYTANDSSYLTENRSLLNYEENSRFTQEKNLQKNLHFLLRMVWTLIKMHYTSIKQNFRTLYRR